MIARQPLTGRARTIVLALVGAALFYLLVWPTLYVIEPCTDPSHEHICALRVNRWTGRLQLSVDTSAWMTPGGAPK